MTMQNKLLHLFPDYAEGDWALQNDGSGPYIVQWNRAEPQPDQATVDAVSAADADTAAETAALKRDFEVSKRDKALVKWIADLHNLTPNEARQQLRAIWRQVG